MGVLPVAFVVPYFWIYWTCSPHGCMLKQFQPAELLSMERFGQRTRNGNMCGIGGGLLLDSYENGIETFQISPTKILTKLIVFMVSYPRCGFGLQTMQMERCRSLFTHSFWRACLVAFSSFLNMLFCRLVLLLCFLKCFLNTTEAFIRILVLVFTKNMQQVQPSILLVDRDVSGG